MPNPDTPLERVCEILEKIEKFYNKYKEFKESLEDDVAYSQLDVSGLLVELYAYNHEDTKTHTPQILADYAAQNP